MKKLISKLLLILCLMGGSVKAYADEPSTFLETYSSDALEIELIRAKMEEVIFYIENTPEIFQKNKQKGSIFSRKDRMEIWQTWQIFLDQIQRLDNIGARNDLLYKKLSGDEKRDVFNVSYAAFLTEYRYSMELFRTIDKNASLHKVLNENVVELSLDKNTYADLKYRFLHFSRAVEFVRLDVVYDSNSAEERVLDQQIKEDSKWLYKSGLYSGPKDTLGNALQILQDSSFSIWYSVKSKALLIGTAKVWRFNKYLITNEQIDELDKKLEPGDILLEKREWYLSNLGLPGFWPHTAFYIGEESERVDYFNDTAVISWVKSQGHEDGSFVGLLKSKYPKEYAISQSSEEGYPMQVIESIARGVVFTSLHYSAKADSVAVLRPNVSKLAKAKAILHAFHYVGRPYDYDFNFESDNKLVCSELVYKAYEDNGEGFTFPITSVLGKKVLKPNSIAKAYSEDLNSDKPRFSFVEFIDGDEYKQQSFISDAQSFSESWKRPKWHIITN